MSEDALIRRTNLKALGLSPRQLADKVGNTYQYWRDLLETDKSFGEKTARNIESKLGLPRGLLDLINAVKNKDGDITISLPTGAGKTLPQHVNFGAEKVVILKDRLAFKQESLSDEFVIPQFETGGSMGHGLLLRDQPGVIRGWSVNQEWLSKNIKNHSGAANLCIVTGFGDSMKGMYNSGDPLVVDTGVRSVEYDAVYFFRVGEEGFIKRLQRIPGEGLVAISENKAYRDWTIKPDMDFEVFGRVLKAWKGEDF